MTRFSRARYSLDMDKIFLQGLEVPCRVGCTDRERELPQSLRVDVTLACPTFASAYQSDALEDTVDYGIARDLVACVQGRAFRLIETVAETLAQRALEHPYVAEVTIRISKRAPVESLAFSGVEITRVRGKPGA